MKAEAIAFSAKSKTRQVCPVVWDRRGRPPGDIMAHAYLEDYVLQRYRTLATARARVEHLREFFGGWPAEAFWTVTTEDAFSEPGWTCPNAVRPRELEGCLCPPA